jgi:Rps23 Pro-64 3,4-dihydroxylase Tpa1-like proline 4-hydroxylase
MPTKLLLNPAHDPAALSADYAAGGRLQIPDFLEAQTAGYLYQLLQENSDWYLSYNEGGENFESSLADFEALAPAQQHRFMSNIYSRARDGFQYVFRQYYISQALALGEQPGHPMHQLHHFVNSPGFLAFMRTLTRRDDIQKSDSYASWYGPGHFLTQHDDRHASHDRVAAYVISMTRKWNENWGGYLAFYDDAGNIEQAFKPTFNTLNIFSIPKKHAVQLVAPFAGHPRTSYLGWLQR